jgi:hypothetical protein
MEEMPKDPFMLLSWVNMKLRDQYESLQALCNDLDIDLRELTDKLAAVGFDYMPEINQFR